MNVTNYISDIHHYVIRLIKNKAAGIIVCLPLNINSATGVAEFTPANPTVR